MEHYDNKELGLLMQSLTSKIDQFMKDNHEEHCEMHNTLKEHNGRLKKIEIWRGYMTGGMVIIGLIFGSYFLPLLIKSFYLAPVQAEQTK